MKLLVTFVALAASNSLVLAFPGYAGLKRADTPDNTQRNATLCYPWPPRPFKKAVPYDKRFPYLGARGSQVRGTGKGDILVPAKGDKAHEFHPPHPGAYRGPCPGLNVAANHGFISRDGVSTYDELVEMGQNLWNLGYDASVALAATGVALDGDMETGTLSIGADASCTGQANGGGLNLHDTFEVDASYARNDYYYSPVGDDYSLNTTLWAGLVKLGQEMQNTSKPRFTKELMGAWKSIRSDQSKAENPRFHRGTGSLLLYGAAGLTFEGLAGSGNSDFDTMMAMHGVEEDGEGGYIATVNERIPPNWRNRKSPWTIPKIAVTIREVYLPYWKEFGRNEGLGNWIPEEYQFPKNGTADEIVCFLYDSLSSRGRGPSPLPRAQLKYITDRVNPFFAAAGCEVVEVA